MKRFNNILINRLGITNIWINSFLSSNISKKNSIFNFFNINKLIYILLKSGIIYKNHLYTNNYFNFLQLTLPVFISNITFFKFYRIKKIKNNVTKVSKFIFLRKTLYSFFFSKIKIFNFNNWFVIYLQQYSFNNNKYLSYKYGIYYYFFNFIIFFFSFFIKKFIYFF